MTIDNKRPGFQTIIWINDDPVYSRIETSAGVRDWNKRNQDIFWSLFQIMACRLFGTKPSSEAIDQHCNYDSTYE